MNSEQSEHNSKMQGKKEKKNGVEFVRMKRRHIQLKVAYLRFISVLRQQREYMRSNCTTTTKNS